MKAVWMEQFGAALTVATVADPATPPDGVVVKVMASGVCRSDWHAWMGHDPDVGLPHVPGHELAGIVEDAGPQVQRWQRGDRVTLPFCCGCGSCAVCHRGDQQVCPDQYQPGFSGWGSFAQYVAVPHADTNLVRLPETLDFVSAASLGCRVITAFRGVVDQGRTLPGEWVAVHGCGGVGLAAVAIAAAAGACVVGIDIMPRKLELARNLGAVAVVDAGNGADPVPEIIDITGGGAQVSIDALGHPATCRNSIRCLTRRGRHVQIGLTLAEHAQVPVPMNEIIARELEILGSHGMQAHRFPDLLRMIESGALQPARLIGKRLPLEDAPAELEAMTRFEQEGVAVIDHF